METFLEEKRSSQGVTLASYAKSFGLSAPTLQMIFSGKRNLTLASIHEIARVLKLSKSERGCFEAMVHRDQSEDSETRSYYARRIRDLERGKDTRKLRVSDQKILSHALMPALLIYLLEFLEGEKIHSLQDFPVEDMAKKFNLSVGEVRSAFKRFEKNGLLDIRPDKRFHIVFEKVAHHLSKKEYLKKVGSEAISRVDQSFEDTSSNYVRSFTLSIAHDDIRNLGGEIAQVFDKYMAKDRTSPNCSS